MKTPESKSIRRQLEVSVTLAVALLFAIGACGVFFFIRADVNRQFLDKLERHLEGFVEEIEMDVEAEVDANFHELALAGYDPDTEAEVEEEDDEDEDEEEDDEDEFEDAIWYVFRDHRGDLIFASPWLKDESILPFEPESEDDSMTFGLRETAEGLHLRTASTSFQLPLEVLDPEEIGVVDTAPTEGYDAAAPENRVHLTIGESDEEIRHLLAVLALALGGTGLVIIGATSWLISRLIRRACRPIETISVLTASIDTEHLDSRLPEGRAPAELEPLVRQFNALLDRVEKAFSRERRFSADIAHELRTPVAELRSLAEVALAPSLGVNETTEDPADVYRETAAIGERMGRLIEVLSELHRTESVTGEIGAETVSVPDILEQAVAAAASVAESRELSIEVRNDSSNGSSPRITTDPAMFRGILDNLLGNAVTYSESGRPVVCRISGQPGNGTILLEIRNATDRLTANDLAHLHEPFWQKDAARSEASHFGLGLSTVAAYAKLLAITVDYRLDDGDFVAELRLPGAR